LAGRNNASVFIIQSTSWLVIVGYKGWRSWLLTQHNYSHKVIFSTAFPLDMQRSSLADELFTKALKDTREVTK